MIVDCSAADADVADRIDGNTGSRRHRMCRERVKGVEHGCMERLERGTRWDGSHPRCDVTWMRHDVAWHDARAMLGVLFGPSVV